MPRKRRNRKNRRKNYKHPQNVDGIQSSRNKQVFVEESTQKEGSNFITLPNSMTNLKTPNTKTLSKTNQRNNTAKNSLVHMTPKNVTKRSNELNATNLCKLFDDEIHGRQVECLNNVTPKSRKNTRHGSPFNESYINNLSASTSTTGMILLKNRRGIYSRSKIRSNSSMSKLHSPGLDKIPIMVDVATQTVYFDNTSEKKNSSESSDIYLQNCINIFETPKINQMQKLERAFETPLSHMVQSNNTCKDVNMTNKKQSLKCLFDYISPQVIQNDLRTNESDCEPSFFNPQLKQSSTPIEKVQKDQKIFESMARNILNAQLDRKLLERQTEKMTNYYNSTPKTPSNKIMFEDKVCSQKVNKIDNYIYKKRMYKSISPKKLNDISSKIHNKSRNMSIIRSRTPKNDSSNIPKTFSPQKTSFSKSDNFFNVSNTNVYARFMTNVKKIHNRYLAAWLNRITDVCSWFGITIKRKLSSLCASTGQNSHLSVIEQIERTLQQRVCSNCKDYQTQIITLTTKVDLLGREITVDREKIDSLQEEVGKMREELLELNVIKEKICHIEEKFKASAINQTPPAPPPPPLPPPPPPLPSPVLTSSASVRSLKSGNKRNEKHFSENSRPVISLDDILNVKLKKTSDKPHLPRRATQPFISVEMLSQIKLKPTPRLDIPSSAKEVSSTSPLLSSSPASSLTKILNNVDTNVRRIKRLRSRYSLDDSRRYILRRERYGNTDS